MDICLNLAIDAPISCVMMDQRCRSDDSGKFWSATISIFMFFEYDDSAVDNSDNGGLAQPPSEVFVLGAESVDPFAGQSGKLEESIATWWSRWQVWPWLWVWLPGDLDTGYSSPM